MALQREVQYCTLPSDINLSATLAISNDEKAKAVLVSGSGPNDRDYKFHGNGLFLKMSEFLSEKGVSTVRWDHRGVNGSEGNHFQASSSELLHDIYRSIKVLNRYSKSDQCNLYLIGHSLGASMVLDRLFEEECSGVILLSISMGSSIKLIANRYMEYIYDLNKGSVNKDGLKKDMYRYFSILYSGKEKEVIRDELSSILDVDMKYLSEISKHVMPKVENISPDLSYYCSEDVISKISKTRKPILIINGSSDLKLNVFDRTEQLLDFFSRPEYGHVTTRILDGVGHNLSYEDTDVSPELFSIIDEWLCSLEGDSQ